MTKKSTAKKPTWMWASLDKGGGVRTQVYLWPPKHKPRREDGVFYGRVDGTIEIRTRAFKALFGWLSKPGQLCKVRFTAKVVKD